MRHEPARLTRSRPPNVIILTAGLTGSSVIAGLLAGAGYWVGSETIEKPDYDTFENRDLVALNDRILAHAGHHERFDRVFRPESIDALVRRTADVAPEPYRHFIDSCDRQAPWLWKDPRLWLTIRFWAGLIDLSQVRVIIVRRQQSQAWVSHILRRQIQTPRYCRAYMEGIHASSIAFVEEFPVPYIDIVYEQILLAPEETIERIGNFLGIELSMDDLRRSCRGQLYRKHHGALQYLLAVLIYLKNYPHRSRHDRLGSG